MLSAPSKAARWEGLTAGACWERAGSVLGRGTLLAKQPGAVIVFAVCVRTQLDELPASNSTISTCITDAKLAASPCADAPCELPNATAFACCTTYPRICVLEFSVHAGFGSLTCKGSRMHTNQSTSQSNERFQRTQGHLVVVHSAKEV